MKNKSTVISLLEMQREFTNQHGVNFYLMDDGKMEVSCMHPNFDHSMEFISLELYSKYNSFSSFALTFSIHLIHDLDRITPESLLEQYVNGNENIEIYCMIDDFIYGGSLRFRKNNTGLFAADDVTEKYHQVSDSIQDPEDFIKYTCKYFLLAPSFSIGNTEMRKN